MQILISAVIKLVNIIRALQVLEMSRVNVINDLDTYTYIINVIS